MSKTDGYIPISRKLFEHPFWTQKRVFSYAEAWIDLISLARYDDSPTKMIIRNQTVEINRGEVPISLRYLAERWSWSKNKVVLFLEKLTNDFMIKMGTLKGTTQTILTICNYDTYNSLSDKEGQQKGQERDSGGTVKGQSRDKTNKDNKDNKEINKNKSFDLSFVDSSFLDVFQSWLNYKKERKESYKSQTSLETVYKKLIRESDNNPDTAKLIIENSIANNWMGFFPLKENKKSDVGVVLKNSKNKDYKKGLW